MYISVASRLFLTTTNFQTGVYITLSIQQKTKNNMKRNKKKAATENNNWNIQCHTVTIHTIDAVHHHHRTPSLDATHNEHFGIWSKFMFVLHNKIYYYYLNTILLDVERCLYAFFRGTSITVQASHTLDVNFSLKNIFFKFLQKKQSNTKQQQ